MIFIKKKKKKAKKIVLKLDSITILKKHSFGFSMLIHWIVLED